MNGYWYEGMFGEYSDRTRNRYWSNAAGMWLSLSLASGFSSMTSFGGYGNSTVIGDLVDYNNVGWINEWENRYFRLDISGCGAKGCFEQHRNSYIQTFSSQYSQNSGSYLTGIAPSMAMLSLDSSTATATPEPGTWALMAGGVGIMIAARKRRQAK